MALRNFGAIWVKKDKQGRQYLSGNIEIPFLGSLKIVGFKNDKKGNDKAPDFHLSWDTDPDGGNDKKVAGETIGTINLDEDLNDIPGADDGLPSLG